VDAKTTDKLNDDRMYPTKFRKLVTELTPHVARIKQLHKDKNPKHWTIKDGIQKPTNGNA
jgi:F0F1-type ATP synthase epsilon subunit